MPLIQVTLIKGRDEAVVKKFAKAVARVAHEQLDAPLNSIRVVINEVPATHWLIGDETREEIDAKRRQQ
jgi:4-oxalocrotonate tautomerase